MRGSYNLSEDLNAEHLPHTTIGVVIPTTPQQQQEQQHPQRRDQNSDPLWQHIINPLSRGRERAATGGGGGERSTEGRSYRIIPDGAPSQPQQQTRPSRIIDLNSAANRHLDDRILEIQDYIRATSSLINTINQEKVRNLTVNYYRCNIYRRFPSDCDRTRKGRDHGE